MESLVHSPLVLEEDDNRFIRSTWWPTFNVAAPPSMAARATSQ